MSIISILLKIYEKIFLLQLTDFIKFSKVYSKYKSCYWKNHSTTIVLANLCDDINQLTKLGNLTVAILPVI